MGPGENSLGGVARILAARMVRTSAGVSTDASAGAEVGTLVYDVKYVLGGSETGVAARFVHAQDMTRGPTARENRTAREAEAKTEVEKETQARKEEQDPD